MCKVHFFTLVLKMLILRLILLLKHQITRLDMK